jgi:segregation and condensation protein A
MASTLTKIKSKMLLPVHDEDEDDDDDPRQELTGPLLEYLQMKSAAENLASRHLLGKDTFVRNPDMAEDLFGSENEMIKVGLFELIDAFQKILENLAPDERVDLTADRISVKDKISKLVDTLEKEKSITLNELFADAVDKSEVIITFLAILEMVKLSLIRIVQHVTTGIIRLFYI